MITILLFILCSCSCHLFEQHDAEKGRKVSAEMLWMEQTQQRSIPESFEQAKSGPATVLGLESPTVR